MTRPLRPTVVYLTRVTNVDDSTIGLVVWSATSVSQKGLKPVMILDKNDLPTTIPRSLCKPWMWQLPVAGVPECVLARDLAVPPDGMLSGASRRIMISLHSGMAMRKFLS